MIRSGRNDKTDVIGVRMAEEVERVAALFAAEARPTVPFGQSRVADRV